MAKKHKRVIVTLGFIFLVFGLTGSIPSFLQKSYFGLSAAAFFAILGVILWQFRTMPAPISRHC